MKHIQEKKRKAGTESILMENNSALLISRFILCYLINYTFKRAESAFWAL